MYLPEYVKNTLSKLNKNGYCAYLVGGCVRDSIMGRDANDFDITTNALPDEILDVFKDEKTLDIGIKHGTVTVVYGKELVEVTTYRIDGGYTDNRHPEAVEFTDNIELDLKRRDFTSNAIAYSPILGFVDPFNGKQHIRDKVIKCVGNPDERFNEDSLRILRGLRFASVLDFDIEQKTALSIKDNAKLLNNISAERINAEFSKMLCGIRADVILAEFRSVFQEIFPELRTVDEKVYMRTVNAVKCLESDLCVRLALFFSMFSDGNEVLNTMKRIKYDNKTSVNVSEIVKYMNVPLQFNRIHVRKAVNKLGFMNSKTLFKVLMALNPDEKDKYQFLLTTVDSVRDNNDCVTLSQLALDGKFLSDRYGLKGRQIGATLQMLLDGVIEDKFENNITNLVEILDNRS